MRPSVLTPHDLAAALAVVLIWGLNFVAMKLALHDFTPMQLGAVRYVFAALPLILFVKRPAVGWRWVLAYGLVQGVGQFGLLFLALRLGMTAALASVLMQTQVFFTALMAFFLLHERLSRPLVGGLLFALAGLACFLMSLAGGQAAGGVTLAGFALNLAAAAMWACSNILARQLQRAVPTYDPIQFVVWSAIPPILPFVLLSLWLDVPELRWRWLHASPTAWLGAMYLGWMATILAYGLWTGLLKRHAANRVAPFSLGVPVVGLLAGVVILGEHITLWQGGGIAFIVLALAYVMLAKKPGPLR
ncbi:EamA family transporter [Roseateles koreensis]|uniref:EamA family transporter n=1 Tax=Roseateles koreensis TaxID=2987526 RepID=A0ABT5KUZ1_9BURK|nr:EamA family transporter [Roseateles koreensis]MDC8786752.1 EamA family transporter [Roseateles koreensis]